MAETPQEAYYDHPKVNLIDWMGDDASIVQAARVSLEGRNEVFVEDELSGLINYLMREKHGSPFEHNSMKFYVKAPIFVFREFHRHRMMSYNEMSARYTDLPGEFYLPPMQRPIINVGTSARPEMAPAPYEMYDEMCQDMYDVYSLAWDKYCKMLDDGVAKELARIILPVGIFSQMYVTMNLRSAFNFLALRIQDKDAVHVSRPQWEIEQVALKIEERVRELFPIAYAAFINNGRVAP